MVKVRNRMGEVLDEDAVFDVVSRRALLLAERHDGVGIDPDAVTGGLLSAAAARSIASGEPLEAFLTAAVAAYEVEHFKRTVTAQGGGSVRGEIEVASWKP